MYQIDDDFSELINSFCWHRSAKGYFQTRWVCDCKEGSTTMFMHKLIMNKHYLPDDVCLCDNSYYDNGLHIDHVNGNKSDNRLSNLQFMDMRMNSSKKPNKITKYVGIRPSGIGFMVRVTHNGTRKYLGTFSSIDIARKTYVDYCEKYNIPH